jgi:hypothetical protein
VEIILLGEIESFLTRARFGPFLDRRTTTSTVYLEFQCKQAGTDQNLGPYVYNRHDMSFYSDGVHSSAWYDGDLSGFLACLELSLYAAITRMDGILLHASAGVLDGQAWLMPGPSGTGKSTAALGGFDRVLSDERVMVTKESRGFVVWGTPFWSDGRRLPLDCISARLGGIAKLVKAKSPMKTHLCRGDMLAWLMGSVVAYGDDEPNTRTRFQFASDLVESAICINLDFPREGSWAPSMLSPIGQAS